MSLSGKIVCLIGSTLVLSSALGQVVDPKLYASIVNGGVEELTAYLNAGGSPAARIKVPHEDSSITLLELAIRGSKEDPALVLLVSGARPDNTTEFVEIAAEKGFADVLAYVLDEDPSLVHHMRTEHHPLFLAIAGGHYDAVSILLERMKLLGNAEREEILNEALSVALNSFDPGADPTVVYDLLDAGADPVTTIALALAVSRCEPSLVSTFLAAGADARKLYDLGGGPVSPAQYAARCFKGDQHVAIEVFSELKTAGADVCAVDPTDNRVPEAARVYLRDVEECN